jgi:hypothetical protein
VCVPVAGVVAGGAAWALLGDAEAGRLRGRDGGSSGDALTLAAGLEPEGYSGGDAAASSGLEARWAASSVSAVWEQAFERG